MNVEQMRAHIARRQRAVLRQIASRERKIAALRAEQDALRTELVNLTETEATKWARGRLAS